MTPAINGFSRVLKNTLPAPLRQARSGAEPISNKRNMPAGTPQELNQGALNSLP